MSKVMSVDDAISVIKDGDTILVGGFGPKGYPGRLMRSLLKNSKAKDLFFLANAPNPFYLASFEKLLETRSRGLIATYIRSSKIAEKMFEEKTLELIPQGTLAERLRAGGVGIPAFYTPVGVGTLVEEGKQKMVIDDKTYLMEKAIKGDVSLIRATKVDLDGNCYMRASIKTFGALMPAAAKYTVVEAEELVQVGEIDPELVTVPGIFVDAIVRVGG